MKALNALTELQKELGYKPGKISLIALLGLIGEAGEVSEEIQVSDDCMDLKGADKIVLMLMETETNSKAVDKAKKSVRQDPAFLEKFKLEVGSPDKLKAELADVFYYLNGLAINVGMSIEELAQMSYDKVTTRVKTIGRVA